MMNRVIFGIVGLCAMVVGATGCGGVAAGSQSACQAYVTKYNALSCVPAEAKLDATTMCPAALDLATCSTATYWNCAAASIKCDSMGMLDQSTVSVCGKSSCN